MNRQALIEEATAAGEAAAHNLDLIRREPERVIESKRPRAEAYLIMICLVAEEEKKNTRRPGRMSLRDRLRNLVAIITRNERSVNN